MVLLPVMTIARIKLTNKYPSAGVLASWSVQIHKLEALDLAELVGQA